MEVNFYVLNLLRNTIKPLRIEELLRKYLKIFFERYAKL